MFFPHVFFICFPQVFPSNSGGYPPPCRETPCDPRRGPHPWTSRCPEVGRPAARHGWWALRTRLQWSNVEVDSSPQFWNENKIAGKIRKEWWSITFLSFRFFLGVAICMISWGLNQTPQVGNPPNNSLVGFESWTVWVLEPLTSTKKGRARWPKRFLSGPVYLSTRSGRLKRAIPCFPFHVRLLDGHGGQSFQLTRGQVF